MSTFKIAKRLPKLIRRAASDSSCSDSDHNNDSQVSFDVRESSNKSYSTKNSSPGSPVDADATVRIVATKKKGKAKTPAGKAENFETFKEEILVPVLFGLLWKKALQKVMATEFSEQDTLRLEE